MLLPLSEYVEKFLEHTRMGYEDETIINAIADYLSMTGEFHSEDLKTIYDYEFCAGDFVCDEETPEEVVLCTSCGYQADVEGEVIKAEGCCPCCGRPTIVIYGEEEKE